MTLITSRASCDAKQTVESKGKFLLSYFFFLCLNVFIYNSIWCSNRGCLIIFTIFLISVDINLLFLLFSPCLTCDLESQNISTYFFFCSPPASLWSSLLAGDAMWLRVCNFFIDLFGLVQILVDVLGLIFAIWLTLLVLFMIWLTFFVLICNFIDYFGPCNFIDYFGPSYNFVDYFCNLFDHFCCCCNLINNLSFAI